MMSQKNFRKEIVIKGSTEKFQKFKFSYEAESSNFQSTQLSKLSTSNSF